MRRLTPDQYPVISHVIRDELEFPAITLTYQRREGEFWVDRLEAPSVVIGIGAKDSFAWGDLGQPGAAEDQASAKGLDPSVPEILARARGLITDAPGLEPLLKAVRPTYERIPSVEYRYVGAPFTPTPLPHGFGLFTVGPEHLDLLCQYRPRYRKEGRIGDFRNFEEFFQHGYGYAIIDEAAGKIVSACMAHSVSRRVDHSLRTLTGYEGRGLATACTYATIMEGVRRGLEPIWWTEVDNHGSRAIATKIGLRLVAEPLFIELGGEG